MVRRYEKLEKIVNEGLRLALGTSSADKSLDIILEYIGKALDGERTYIFEKNRDGRDDNTYEWTAPGVPPEIDNLQNLPPEICENWYHIFEEGKYVQIPDIEEMRLSDPFQYENLKRQKIHSIVAMPIYDAEKVIAFYGVDNPPAFSLEYTSDMLQIMGSFLKSCIRRRNLMRRLEDLSYKDALTQLGNRFAMEKYVRQIDPEQSVGVVYCDVTGLKGVNDTLGHKAGDDLILRAGACLEQVFGDYGVFRIGGDELLVLCAQIDQDTLAERIRQLECLTAEKDVNIAVGVIWQDRADTHLDELLQEAEKRMYEDKAEYYKKTGIERRGADKKG